MLLPRKTNLLSAIFLAKPVIYPLPAKTGLCTGKSFSMVMPTFQVKRGKKMSEEGVIVFESVKVGLVSYSYPLL